MIFFEMDLLIESPELQLVLAAYYAVLIVTTFQHFSREFSRMRIQDSFRRRNAGLQPRPKLLLRWNSSGPP